MTKPFVVGLTGSIGMGKSTTAGMFADEGLSVWDADATVHELYSKGGRGVDAVRALCAEAVVDGAVDRSRLSDWLSRSPDNLRALEAAIHPLVADDRFRFLSANAGEIVVLDIPLLFETGGTGDVDAIVVVTAPREVQEARVLSREGMTREHFQRLLSRQVPDAEKRRRADYIVETVTLEAARAQVQNVIRDIRDRINARDRARHGDDRIRPRNG